MTSRRRQGDDTRDVTRQTAALAPAPDAHTTHRRRPSRKPPRRTAADTWWERLRFEVTDAVTSGALSERLVRASAKAEAPITTGRRIVVVGVAGGIGTTTVTALIAKLLGSLRQEAVIAVDATDESGRLLHYAGANDVALLSAATSKLRAQPVRTLPEALEPVASCGNQVFALGRADVPALADAPVRQAEWTDLSSILSRFIAATVVDAGASPRSRHTAALMGTAHAIVVVSPDTEFGSARAASVQSFLSDAYPDTPVVTVWTTANLLTSNLLRERDDADTRLPFDRHLAAGGPIKLSQLGARTRIAATEMAGTALSAANRR